MKTVLFSIILFCTSVSMGQTPLLPLLKQTSQWQVDGSGGGVNISESKQVYKVQGDSIIDGLAYQILTSREEGCSQCVACGNPQTCYTRLDTLLLRQIGNTMVDHKLDTLFSMTGTSVGDSVYFKGSNSINKILAIDSINFGSEKRRAFYFPGFIYFDGIGFSTGGPLKSNVICPFFEASSKMTRYSIANLCYSTKFDGCERLKDVVGVFSPLFSKCMSPLSLQDELAFQSIKVYVNEFKELVHDVPMSQIEIVNSMGQQVLSNQNATKTDLSSLKSGVYVSKIIIGTQTKSYRFLIK